MTCVGFGFGVGFGGGLRLGLPLNVDMEVSVPSIVFAEKSRKDIEAEEARRTARAAPGTPFERP